MKTAVFKIGIFAVALLWFAVGVQPIQAQTYKFITQWGSYGTGNDQFKGPQGVAVDASGNVYVADTDNSRIQKYTAGGIYITSFKNWSLSTPFGVAVDASGNIYVADAAQNLIHKFTSDGTYITQWGYRGTGNGQFDAPTEVAVDTYKNVYVADRENHRIQKFTSDGTYITKWGSYGTGNDQFQSPRGMAVDSLGNVYVADVGNHRIKKFTADGTYITKWGSYGTGNDQFQSPVSVAVDSLCNVYVGDGVNHRIKKFTADGTYITEWYSTGIEGIAIDLLGSVYVADMGSHRIQKYALNYHPEAENDKYTVINNGAVFVVNAPGVLSNDADPDGDAIRAELVQGTSHGALSLIADGSFTYLPNAGFIGTDSFIYRASDQELHSAETTVTLTVTFGVGWYKSDWGFHFDNQTVETISYSRYAETFGEDKVYLSKSVCLGVPACLPFVGCSCLGQKITVSTCDLGVCIPVPLAVPYYLGVYRGIGSTGVCWGLAATSLRFFNGDDRPELHNPTALTVKNLNFSDVQAIVELRHGSQLSAEAFNYYLSHLGEGSKAPFVLDRAREGLQALKQGMVAIKHGLTTGHAMNYDTVQDFLPGSASKIYVYDNNRSYLRDPVIDIDRALDNSWSFWMKSGDLWSNDMILDIPYSLVNRNDWTLPTSMDGLVTLIFSDAKGNIEDMAGNRIGIDASGVAHETIPHGMAVPLWETAGSGITPPPLLMFATKAGDYNVHIFGTKRETGMYTSMLMGFGGGYAFEEIPVTSATSDDLEFRMINNNPLADEISFRTSDAGKLFNATITKSPGENFDNRTYRIKNMRVSDVSKVYLKVMPDHNSLVVGNRGSDTLTYDVQFRNDTMNLGQHITGAEPKAELTNVTIRPNETQTITPNRWETLSEATITIQQSVCGNLSCDLGEDHVNCPEDCAPSAPCVVPVDDLTITTSTTLCPGALAKYTIPDRGAIGVITIAADDVVLDCQGTTLIGDGTGTGIISEGHNKVTIKNCHLQSYGSGIVVGGGFGHEIADSRLTTNTIVGMQVQNTQCPVIRHMMVKDNSNGIQLVNVTHTQMTENLLCPNSGSDISATASDGAGTNNACDRVIGWNDNNQSGCTYSCDEGGDLEKVIVNNYVTFAPITSTFQTSRDTYGCPSGFEGKFRFNAKLTGKGGTYFLSNLVAKVTTLTGGNLVLNADGGPGGVGSTVTFGPIDDYSDGILKANETVRLPFTICLKKIKPFTFFVDVIGSVK